MKRFKTVLSWIFDILEIYIPMVAFIIVFASFLIIIAYRYIFHASMAWLYELNTVTYVWCGILAASYGIRANRSVAFEILYDKFSENGKLAIRILGNLFVLIMFFILLPFAWSSVAFMAVRDSPIMKIPFSIIFFPFVIFVLLTLIHNIYLLSRDIRTGIKVLKGKITS